LLKQVLSPLFFLKQKHRDSLDKEKIMAIEANNVKKADFTFGKAEPSGKSGVPAPVIEQFKTGLPDIVMHADKFSEGYKNLNGKAKINPRELSFSTPAKSEEIEFTPLKTRKWTGINNDNIKAFQTVFNTKSQSINETMSEAITRSVFGSSATDFQKLIGETDANGKIGPKTFFLMEEHLAKLVNGATTPEECEKLVKQFSELKTLFPAISNDKRFTQINNNLNERFAELIHQEVLKVKTPDECLKLGKKIAEFRDAVPELAEQAWRLSEKTVKVFNKHISEAKNLKDFDGLRLKLPEIKQYMTASNFNILKTNLVRGLTNCISESTEKLNDTKGAVLIDTYLKNVKELIGPDFYKGLSDQLAGKAIKLFDKKIGELSTYAQCKEMTGELANFKDSLPPATYEALENALLVQTNKQKLFGTEGIAGIKASKVVQGALNDCFFLSAMAGLAEKRPEEIAKMIKQSPDGKFFTVKFPGAIKEVIVARPTEEELKKYAKQVDKDHTGKDAYKTGDQSIWAAVLEKAYSEYLSQVADRGATSPEARDNINHGGLLSPGINIMTGHNCDTDILSYTSDKPEDIKSDNERMRKKLTEAMANNRIVTISTFGAGSPTNGIPKNHVYTVLGYDAKEDKLIIRNPQAVDPKQIPGVEPMAETDPNYSPGVFKVSLADAHKYFSLIAYEEETNFVPQLDILSNVN
jgi:hypothetical protein